MPEGKIDVIYNAIDERFGEAPDEEEVARVRERYQLNDPFILYAGNIKPHKNLERLIEAFHMLRRGDLGHVKLLIIGDEISKYATLRRAVHKYKLHKHVRFFGFVPDKTLAILYRLAGVFVFPSLYEGFGLPPLEAMASGTPVITSNVSSLPEVVGDAAVLIDPYRPDAIADAMRRVLTEPALHEDLRQRGFSACVISRGSARSGGCGKSTKRYSPSEGKARRRGSGFRARGSAPLSRHTESFPTPESAPRVPSPDLRLPDPEPRIPDPDKGQAKVAIVHDWLTGMRGGEKVLEAICELYPDATLYTLVRVPGSVSARIERHRIKTSPVQWLPAAGRVYRNYLPLFPAAVELFDLDRYDLVISSSHCAAKSVVRNGRATHVCYCHSPMRYAWDQFPAYFGPEQVGPLRSRLLRPVMARLARWDAATAGRVDRFLANSQYVAGRIRRYYNRGSTVVYPPVDTAFYRASAGRREPDPRFLVVSALVRISGSTWRSRPAASPVCR